MPSTAYKPKDGLRQDQTSEMFIPITPNRTHQLRPLQSQQTQSNSMERPLSAKARQLETTLLMK